MSLINDTVLVLNFSYEPLNVTSVKRALILLFLEKAELVENGRGEYISSPTRRFPKPSVVRLLRYIHPRLKSVRFTRSNIIKRDSGMCQYCGGNGKELTIDHVIPLSMGGEDSWGNCVACCKECNNKKGNRTPRIASMTLVRKPKEPTPLYFLSVRSSNRKKEWRKYLFMS